MDLDDIDDDVLNQLMDNFDPESLKESESESQASRKSPGPEHLAVLSKTFGHTNFRPLQWEIISSIIYDKRDVCAVMSTGYGKSLCFQFPSMFLDGITVVISPLISLMEDQVLSLKVSNIPACLLGTAQKKQKEVIDDIFNKKYSIIYLTPEFCTGDIGSDILQRMSNQLSVVLIAIDEAHCISSWGHDFRHHYRQLGTLRNIFKQVPIIAVTATATRRVQEDIVTSLKLRNPLRVCTGFDRPNIYFEVNVKGSCGVYSDLSKLLVHDGSILKFSGPTIIYCITRKETESIADTLKTHGIKCRPYHAGLSLTTRQETHELFFKDEIEVVVATIAFGMGIDKPDIRNVVHYGCSKSIENYYQEVGRSGRDGLPSHCVTFYRNSDFHTLRNLYSRSGSSDAQNEPNLKKVEEYLTSLKCRRVFILEHFEDKVDHLSKPRKSCCDICTKKLYDTRTDHEKYEGIDENGCYDFTDHAKLFLKSVAVFGSTKLGLGTFIKFIRGSSTLQDSKKSHPLFGKGKNQPEIWWQTIARVLVQEKYLMEKVEKSSKFSYTAISLTKKGRDMIMTNEKLVIQPPSTFLKLLKPKSTATQSWITTSRPVNFPSTSKSSISETPPEVESPSELSARMALYRKLLDQRGAIASALDCMPYTVASNNALMALSKLKPTTLDELRRLNIDGFNDAKINKFGYKFLKVITGTSNQVSKDTPLPIKDVMAKHPLPDVVLPLTAEMSCHMYQLGLTIGEIAQKRDVTKGTISSHLIAGLKCGHPIKLAEFGVTEESHDAIVKVYRTFCKTGFTSVKLTPIKEQLPPEITYDEIKAVLAYLQVRYHLKSLNIPYEDFEDFRFNEIDLKEIKSEAEPNPCQSEVKREVKSQEQEETVACKVENKEHENTEQSHISLEEFQDIIESPAKKFKAEERTDFDYILDSPPRQQATVATVSTRSETSTVESNNPLTTKENVQDNGISSPRSKGSKSKKKALPPWLVVRKIR